MLLKIFKYTIFIIAIISCATPPKKKTVKPLTRRERQLLYYQKLRASQWQEITNKKRDSYQKREYHRDKKVSVKPRQSRPKKHIQPSKPQVIPVDPHEQRIEIEQLISFQCIKKRMDNCDELSTRIYEKCLQNFNPGDRHLTDCVKKSLR